MPDYILIEDPHHKWRRVAEKDLPNEAALQQLVRENPEVLPLDDPSQETLPFLTVGRESALSNGYVDVIGIDPEGLITIIESKLDRNPEVKRTVIGQVLGYAAYLWGMSYEQFENAVVRKYFDSDQCHSKDLRSVSLDDAMQAFVREQSSGEGWSEETFRSKVEANLQSGRFRLMIVVDKVNDEMRRTVEFLNQCTGPNFDILCAELRYFESGSTHLIVPALIGRPLASKPRPTSTSTQQWSPETFFPVLAKNGGLHAERIARKLLEWATENSEWVYWGTGIRDGSFNGLIREGPSRVANVFGVWTNGRIELGFAYTSPYPPFDREEMRREWFHRVISIKGVELPADSYNRRPSFPLTALAGETEFNQFTDTIQWVFQQLRDARDKEGI